MSLKVELETWAAALKAYDEQDFERALDLFSTISDTSKILTNMGLLHATLGEHEQAVERFIEATNLDRYLAVAYFQCGVSNFLLARYELALKDFDEALLYLRGHQSINYEQLGLKFKLFSAEVLFNKGLSQIYLGQIQEGLADMEEARRDKATEEHNVIDDAIQDRGEGYTVFSIPVGVLYRPSEKKMKNAMQKDYMGKAKLVAASDPGDAFTEFTGVTRLKQGISPSNVFVETGTTAGGNLSRSATAPNPTSRPLDEARATGLGRANTTINTPARSLSPPQEGSAPRAAPGVARSNTQITPGRPSANAGLGGPARSVSVRRTVDDAPPAGRGTAPPPAPPPKGPGGTRLTEFYDDYIDSYSDAPPPMPANGAQSDRVAAWARNNANPNVPPARSGSRSAPTSSYAPSSFGGVGSVRRKTTRRRPPPRVQSPYEEEEEGYLSGEYEEGPFELVKIRVKLHYQDDVRGMALSPEMPFEEFMDKITAKFGKSIGGLALKFTDEDGGKVSLRDESDYELAIETARESAKGKPEGKLTIWCTDN